MKKLLLSLLTIVFVASVILSVGAVPAQVTGNPKGNAVTTKPDSAASEVLLYEDFEHGFGGLWGANVSDAGLKADAEGTGTYAVTGDAADGTKYVEVTNRNNWSSSIMYDMLQIVTDPARKSEDKAIGENGKYYLSAMVKLLDNDEEIDDEEFFIFPVLFGRVVGGSWVASESIGATVNEQDGWVEIGKNADGEYVPFNLSDFTSASHDRLKLIFRTVSDENDRADRATLLSYAIDNVVIWYVPNTDTEYDKMTKGTNLLSNGSFEDYDAEFSLPLTSATGWNRDGNSGNALSAIVKEGTESVAGIPGEAQTGNHSVYISNRPGAHQSIAVNLKAILDESNLGENEDFFLSVWMKAEPGEYFFVSPVLGNSKGGAGNNGYPGSFSTPSYKVTDVWTEVGLTHGQYNAILREDGNRMDLDGLNWASMRFVTSRAYLESTPIYDGEAEAESYFPNFYFDNFLLWKAEGQPYAAPTQPPVSEEESSVEESGTEESSTEESSSVESTPDQSETDEDTSPGSKSLAGIVLLVVISGAIILMVNKRKYAMN